MSPDRRASVAYATALLASILVLASVGLLERRADVAGREDFSRIWAGPRALVTGHDPYDPAAWRRTAVELGTFPPDTDVYLYPPWVAVALAPLALVPLPVASLAWTVGGLALAAWSLFALCRSYVPGSPLAFSAAATTLLLSGPAVSSFLTGQWTYVLIGGLVGVLLALRAGRPALAGLATVTFLAKPHLFLFAAPALALHALASDRRGGMRFLASGLFAAGALIVASAAILPTWWPAWPLHVGGAQLGPEHVTIPGFLVRSFGEAGAVAALPVLVGLVVIGLRFDRRALAWPAVWIALSVAAAPYANAYDLLLLVVPLVLGAAAIPQGTRARAILFGTGTAILLIFASLLHDLGALGYAPLVPIAMLALLVVGLWDRRRRVSDPGAA